MEGAARVRVAVDFGTSSTCVVLAVNSRPPQVVVVDGRPLLGSAVFAGSDGTLFVGQEAERQAAIDPSRYEPHPERRIDEGELLLGAAVLPVSEVVPEPVAAAVFHAAAYPSGDPARPDDALAVLDLGAGTVDAAVVRREDG